jgi:hypothetical protein
MAESAAAPAGRVGPGRAWTIHWPTIRGLLLAWLGALVVAHLLQAGLKPPRLGLTFLAMVAESVVYFLYFAALLSFEPVRAWLQAIPSPHRTIIAVFFFALAAGQLTLVSRRSYPFPSWTMYGRPDTPRTLAFYRYYGIDRAGRKVEVDPAKLFTFVNVAEIASRVRSFGRALDARKEATRETARARMRDWLLAVGTAYNLEHPDAPLRSLEFVRYTWEYRGGPASEVPPEPLARIELPAGATP